METRKLSVRTMVSVAMLSAVAYVLMLIDFSVPLMPSCIKMDLSDLPALIGAYALGPVAGVLVCLFKNLLHLLVTRTGGVGELANFLMGAAFVLTAGAIYRFHKTKKTALLGCLAGSLVMGIAAALANYYILLPLFEQFMPLDQLIASFEAYIPFIHSKRDIVLYNALPFNVLKGLAISLITMLSYKSLRPILKGRETT